jgi:hypothetical protein
MLKDKLATLPDLYTTDGVKGDLPAVYVFTPDANATWVLWEYNAEEGLAFGLCDLGLGFAEMGEVSVQELEALRGRFGLPVEVDKSVRTRFAGYAQAGTNIPEGLKS